MPVKPPDREPKRETPLRGGVFIAFGANLPHPLLGSPLKVLEHAVRTLGDLGLLEVLRQSRWYRSRPVPPSGQPWFINGVAEIHSQLPPPDLLRFLHAIEAEFGRVRSEPNAARTLDLDLIDYRGLVVPETSDPSGLILPHPRCDKRAFVLLPLREISPGWQHPVTRQPIEHLIANLDSIADVEPMAPSGGFPTG